MSIGFEIFPEESVVAEPAYQETSMLDGTAEPEPPRPLYEVITEAQNGSEAAFAEMWRQCTPMLHRVAGNIVGTDRAEDIAQVTAMRAFPKLTSIELPTESDKKEAHLRAWLTRIATNAAIDERRHDARTIHALSLEAEDPYTEGTLEEWFPDPAEGPEETVVSRDIIHRALMKVPSTYRETVAAIDVAGMNNSEYARDSGKKRTTVNGQLKRGREWIGNAIRDGRLDGLSAE